MELFEILFILFFILIPVFEGIRKGRQRRGSEDIELPTEASRRPDRPGQSRPTTSEEWPGRGPEPRAEPESVEAADMLPDDLWEVLTGERRQRPSPVPTPAPEPEDRPWTEEPPWERDDGLFAEERFEPAPWEEERDEVRLDESMEPRLPATEQPLQAEVDRYPATPRRIPLSVVLEEPRPVRRTSPLMRSLRHPDGLRNAVLLREILGPPRGLEPPGGPPPSR